MKRHSTISGAFLLSLSLAAGLLFAASNASAQTTESVTIPFAFSANNQQVPAGSYKVELMSDRFLALRDARTADTLIFMVRPESGLMTQGPGHLTFRRVGGQNYLTQVWIPGTSLHSELTGRPKREQRVAKNVSAASSTFEVAMK